MNRTTFNFWLDTLLALVLLTLAAVSVVVRWVFPPAVQAAGWTLWGGSYNTWSWLQFGLVCALLLGVLLHVMLHWSWVCGVVARWLARDDGKRAQLDDGTQTLYGVGLLIVLLHLVGGVVAAAALTIHRPS